MQSTVPHEPPVSVRIPCLPPFRDMTDAIGAPAPEPTYPPSIAEADVHYVQAGVQATGADVTAWTNRGTLADAGNLESSGSPQLESDVIGTESGVSFPASTGLPLKGTALIYSTAITYFGLCARRNAGTDETICDSDQGTDRHMIRMRLGNTLSVFDGAWKDGPSIVGLTCIPWLVISDGASSVIRVGATSQATTLATNKRFYILGNTLTVGATLYCDSPITEFGIIPRALNSTEQDELITYLDRCP